MPPGPSIPRSSARPRTLRGSDEPRAGPRRRHVPPVGGPHLTAASGGVIDRDELVNRMTGAVKINGVIAGGYRVALLLATRRGAR